MIGRFLSADPYIQDPANSQSLNRYSYCINNPLVLIDPSGFGFWENLGRLIEHGIESIVNSTFGRIVIGVVLAIVSYFIPPLLGVTVAWWGAAAIGGVATMAVGLGAGVGLKQAVFEGAVAFAIHVFLLVTGVIVGAGLLIVSCFCPALAPIAGAWW